MSLTVKAKGDFEQVPAGTHPAYCYAVVDIGLQSSPYGTKPQVIMCFELPNEKVEIDGEQKPMVMSCFYTASLSKRANLRKDLEGWRGRSFTAEELEGFHLKAVLGKPCTLNVFHNEDGKARISGISAAMKGVELPPIFNQPFIFDLEVDSVNGENWQKVPEWIQEFIKKREQESVGDLANEPPPVVDPDFDEEIPFAWAVVLPFVGIITAVSTVATSV